MFILENPGTKIQKIINSFLDRIVRPKFTVAGRRLNSYMLWVYTGVIMGTTAIFTLSIKKGLSLEIIAEIMLLVSVFSLFLYKSTKIIGKTYAFLNWAKKGVYHYQILALIFTGLFLIIRHEPLLAYVDVLVIGLLVYQAFGRIGCLMAGCCHGRPHELGVIYGDKYASTGYPYFIARVRLFPIQLVEALWLFLLTLGALFNISGDYAWGENVAWYIIGYGLGRFFFEFWRGDPGRIYVWGLSEPQWTAFLLTLGVICLELSEVLPFHPWHMLVFLLQLSAVAKFYLSSSFKKSGRQLLLHPNHIFEILGMVNWLTKQSSLLFPTNEQNSNAVNIFTGITSLGLQISLNVQSGKLGTGFQYELSLAKGSLERKSAELLSKLIVRLNHDSSKFRLTEDDRKNYQLWIIQS